MDGKKMKEDYRIKRLKEFDQQFLERKQADKEWEEHSRERDQKEEQQYEAARVLAESFPLDIEIDADSIVARVLLRVMINRGATREEIREALGRNK